jgi:hypothetical protein
MFLPSYAELLELRKANQKRYANGITTRKEYEDVERKISAEIAAAERGRKTGKVV